MSPEQYIRTKRRYDYLMTYRIPTDLTPTVRVERTPKRKLEFSVEFQHAPWLNTFKNKFLNNSDLPEDLKPRAQEAVEVFAKKFAEEHGIPYTEIKCHFNLVMIRYIYE